jgi:hypothetical protein
LERRPKVAVSQNEEIKEYKESGLINLKADFISLISCQNKIKFKVSLSSFANEQRTKNTQKKTTIIVTSVLNYL